MRDFLIFDLDGTLVDSNAICVDILQDMLDDRVAGLTIDARTAACHMSRGGVQMVHALLSTACGDPEVELREFRARYFARVTPMDSLFDGVFDGIGRLDAAGFSLAICSNKPDPLCNKVLSDIGLHGSFATIVGGKPELRPKPALDLLDAVLAGLGTDAARCLFIGDSELDHELADAAGMPFCFMTYGYAVEGWQPPLPHPLRFDDFGSLVEMLLVAGPESRQPRQAGWRDRT